MAKLEYTFKNDTLFKMLFVQYPDLLKQLVATLLNIEYDSIERFDITSPEMPPDSFGEKFCRLDIIMTIDRQRVDLEVQVADEGDYPERSLYYWARAYSSSLDEGEKYSKLPRTVVISIVDFKMFDSAEIHSEFQPLEVTRHTLLTDRMSLHYFELPKLPGTPDAHDSLSLWLALFNANSEEELKQIEATEVPIMKQALEAYRRVTADDDFKEIERLRSLARHNEASALSYAEQRGEQRGEQRERAKWQDVVAEKEAALADKDAIIAQLLAQLQHNN